MNRPARPIECVVWGGLLLVIVSIVGAFLAPRFGRPHPPLPVYGAVPGFSLTNQSGRLVSLADLRGQVWVGDIIFTRCPGLCANMTRQMSELQAALPATALDAPTPAWCAPFA